MEIQAVGNPESKEWYLRLETHCVFWKELMEAAGLVCSGCFKRSEFGSESAGFQQVSFP